MFENLGPEGRALSEQAALTLVDGMSARHDLVGVYVVRLSLESVLPFSPVEADMPAGTPSDVRCATKRPSDARSSSRIAT